VLTAIIYHISHTLDLMMEAGLMKEFCLNESWQNNSLSTINWID